MNRYDQIMPSIEYIKLKKGRQMLNDNNDWLSSISEQISLNES